MIDSKRINKLLLVLLLWNPLMLLLLTRDVALAITIPVLWLIATYVVTASKSLHIKVWAFNLCAILSICFHAELLFREFLSDKGIPNLYELHGKYYFNKPLLNQEFRTIEFVSKYKTNCQGYRMDDLSNPNDTIKKCDWLFIGDSFTQGAQVEYRDLYSSLLFKSFPDKVIVNAGISGAGLYDELNYFKDKGKQLRPKMVFLQVGVFNDFFNIKERHATFQDLLMEKSDLYRYFSYNILSNDSLPLGRWTEPFFPTRQENVDYNIMYRESSDLKNKDIKAFKRCLAEWKKEVNSIGAELVLFLIPSKEQVSPVLLQEVMERYNIKANDLDLVAPNKLFLSTAKDLKIKAFDLTSDFKVSVDFPFYNHDEHLNTVGHQLIANSLKKVLNTFVSINCEYISTTNTHERYPTIQADSSVLYQSQDNDCYMVNRKALDGTDNECLVKSCEELVHPILSKDGRFLAYTEGNQESCETDVILQDNVLNRSVNVNPTKCYAAIPAFSHNGTMISFPMWKDSKKAIANIALYNIQEERIVQTYKTDKECWRPIFSTDDKHLYYIKKENFFVIERMEIATGKTEKVLSVPYDIWDIALSPSGRIMAFAGNKDGNWDLFLYDFTTKHVRQLTHTIGDEWDPAFGQTDSDLWYAGTFGFNDGIFYRRIE